jgi:hypothetical protein
VEDGAAKKSTVAEGDWLSAGSHEGNEHKQRSAAKVYGQIHGGLS